MATEEDRIRVELAAEAALPLAVPGHLFPHRWIETALDLGEKPHNTASYEAWAFRRLSLLEAWREEMLVRHHIHLESERRVGYRVIAPHETTDVAMKRAKRELDKALTGATNKLVYGSRSGLSPSELRNRHEALGHLGMITQAVRMARPRPARLPGQGQRDWEKALTPPLGPVKVIPE